MTELSNPILGISATILERTPELMRSDVRVSPGGNGGPPHRHMHQEERFRVLEGTVEYHVAGKTHLLGPGETLAVPPGTVHTFRNPGPGDARFHAEFTPPLRVEEFFANIFGLARDGRTNDKGFPSPLQGAALLHEFPREFFYPPVVPPLLMRALLAPLALLARAKGLKGAYPEYALNR